MSRFVFLLALLSALFIPHSALPAPPNILLIVGDDIGYGDLKFVRVGTDSGLFKVRTDPNETTDLSQKRPILTRQLQAKWLQWDKLNALKGTKP